MSTNRKKKKRRINWMGEKKWSLYILSHLLKNTSPENNISDQQLQNFKSNLLQFQNNHHHLHPPPLTNLFKHLNIITGKDASVSITCPHPPAFIRRLIRNHNEIAHMDGQLSVILRFIIVKGLATLLVGLGSSRLGSCGKKNVRKVNKRKKENK